MTYNATFSRKIKPNKPDFEHNGETFWISKCDCIEMWDGECGDYQSPLIIFSVLHFDTDEKVNPKKETISFFDKVDKKGRELFPNAGKYLS
jgi:hypothetical protein